MKASLLSSLRPPRAPWRLGLAAIQLLAFVLLTAGAASPDLHELIFHSGNQHDAHADTAGADDRTPSDSNEPHGCSLCVWSHGGFVATVPADFAFAAPASSEDPSTFTARDCKSPGRSSQQANAIRGPPKFSS